MPDNILSENQIRFLEEFGKEKALAKNFYLTGGTPLAAFYLNHRYSEDLDFFSEREVDVLAIDIFLQKYKKELGINKIDYEQSFNRNLFFLHFQNEILKTEFTFFPFARIESGIKNYGVDTDSLLDIAVNKLFTIYQRTKARDYVDLFFICKEKNYNIDDLIKKSKIKFDWHIDSLQLGSQFIRVAEAGDWPKMIKPLDKKELILFFEAEAKNLRNQILE
ncbi:MAG: nucleotidyl transferase AbiEii/AbiGii toxin family protein [Patescibacteria group bacterium]